MSTIFEQTFQRSIARTQANASPSVIAQDRKAYMADYKDLSDGSHVQFYDYDGHKRDGTIDGMDPDCVGIICCETGSEFIFDLVVEPGETEAVYKPPF